MNLNREENYKYRKLALTVLSKALDDICPTFEGEPIEIKDSLIQERIFQFKENEKALDAEWKTLEREALQEVAQLKKSAKAITRKLEKTSRTKRIKLKVAELQRKKQKRTYYLNKKLSLETAQLDKQIKSLNPTTKKFAQIQRKKQNLIKNLSEKILASEKKYDKIIQNTLNSNNSALVAERLKASAIVWDKRYKKLEKQFREKEIIFNNKSFELDQIRLSVRGFVEEAEKIKHWCILSGVSLLTCYTSVQERLALLGRNSLEINDLVEKIKVDGEL